MTTDTGSATTRATVEELLRRIGEGDPARIAEMYADAVDWKLSWPDDEHDGPVPWIRRRSTGAEAAEHFALIAAHHDPLLSSTEVSAVLVDGADAVVLGVLANTVSSTGRSYRASLALHLTVEDGLVVRHHVYEDSLSVARAFAGSPASGGSAVDA